MVFGGGPQGSLSDVSAITDYTGNLVLDFMDYRLDDEPKYSVEECKERDATYAAPLRVTARLLNKETGEVKQQEIFMGDFPLMTDSGTFVINGAERVIVSQLVRSPGVYYGMEHDKTGKELFTSTVIPNRGAWLEYETDSNDIFYVRIDKNRKIPVTAFIRALGLGHRPRDHRLLRRGRQDHGHPREGHHQDTPRRACSRSTASCAPASRRRWTAPRPTSTTSSSTPAATTCPRWAATSTTKSWPSATRITGQKLAEPVIDPLTGELLCRGRRAPQPRQGRGASSAAAWTPWCWT